MNCKTVKHRPHQAATVGRSNNDKFKKYTTDMSESSIVASS